MRIEELGPPYIGGRVCASDPFSDALRRAPLKQHRRQDYGHTHTLNKAYVLLNASSGTPCLCESQKYELLGIIPRWGHVLKSYVMVFDSKDEV